MQVFLEILCLYYLSFVCRSSVPSTEPATLSGLAGNLCYSDSVTTHKFYNSAKNFFKNCSYSNFAKCCDVPGTNAKIPKFAGFQGYDRNGKK